jgi:hypothetical protein
LKRTIGAKRMPGTGAAGSAITVGELRRVDSVVDFSARTPTRRAAPADQSLQCACADYPVLPARR